MKSDKSIINDLPDKVEMDSFASLTNEQASPHKKTHEKAMMEIEGIRSSDQQSLFVRQGKDEYTI
ncbi:MAG: hypothetical protein ACOCXW_01870 [Bacteroidota bacterium]